MSQTGTLVPVFGKLLPPLEVSMWGDGALVGVWAGASVVVVAVVVGVTSTGTITAAACRVMVREVVVLQLPFVVTT